MHIFGDGSRPYQKRGKKALPLLVARAKGGRNITYGQLARQMKVHHRTLAPALGAIGNELKALGRKWKEKIPPINCLVVNKTKGSPGKGINFLMPYHEFQNLTPLGKREVMRDAYRGIWGYPKWDEVLHHFGIAPVVPAMELESIATKARYGTGGVGETEDHRSLKAYLAKNPQVLGLRGNRNAKQEYPFPSNDRIDILFKYDSRCVGVEVKGLNADEPELMRGIYQCVKYRALIEADQRYEQETVDSRVILAIGGNMRDSLAEFADLLEIEVRQNITVPASFLATKAAKA